MEGLRCWNCRSVQPPVSGPYRTGHCVFCGAGLGPAPVSGPVRWVAARPPGAPAAPRRTVPPPYLGPPRYRERPRWGFVPSIWMTRTGTPTPDHPAPVRQLRSVALLGRATAVICLLAAGFEGWRYVLLVRGRTEVLSAIEVQLSDALVTATGWAALMMALVTAATLIITSLRLERHGQARAGVGPARPGWQRLLMLVVPGWNLYGAGAVLAEIDALLALDPSAAPPTPPNDRLRWRTRELPTVTIPTTAPGALLTTAPGAAPGAAPGGGAPAVGPEPQHRSPGRLVTWWWVVWVVNGGVTLWAAVGGLLGGDLQSRANLVAVHVLLSVLAAAVALLTVAVMDRWTQLLVPAPVQWPAGWILQPGGQPDAQPDGRPVTDPGGRPDDQPGDERGLQPVGSGPEPRSATEASNG